MRGFAKVRGEWSLMALCYNFSRVLNILGFDRWRARLAQRAAKLFTALLLALLRTYRRASGRPAAIWPTSRHRTQMARLGLAFLR